MAVGGDKSSRCEQNRAERTAWCHGPGSCTLGSHRPVSIVRIHAPWHARSECHSELAKISVDEKLELIAGFLFIFMKEMRIAPESRPSRDAQCRNVVQRRRQIYLVRIGCGDSLCGVNTLSWISHQIIFTLPVSS